MTRCVIVDDEEAYALSLSEMLAMEPDMEVVGTASNGVEALALIELLLPDVVLMDLEMPVMGGVEATRLLKARVPGVEVLVFTYHGDDAHLFEAIRAGAKGYLLKDAEFEEVIEAVRSVALGVAAIPSEIAARVLAEFQRLSAQGPALQQLYDALSRQEIEVLKLIGSGMSNREIAETLSLELTTVKKHITNIRQKLEINSRIEAAQLARASGLR